MVDSNYQGEVRVSLHNEAKRNMIGTQVIPWGAPQYSLDQYYFSIENFSNQIKIEVRRTQILQEQKFDHPLGKNRGQPRHWERIRRTRNGLQKMKATIIKLHLMTRSRRLGSSVYLLSLPNLTSSIGNDQYLRFEVEGQLN